MEFQDVRRVAIEQFEGEFNRIIDEIVATGEPVIIHEQGKDLVAIVNIADFQKLLLDKDASPTDNE